MDIASVIRRNPSSTITSVLTFLALLVPFVDGFREAAEPFNVDPVVWVVVSAVLGAAVIVGQMWQAGKSVVVPVTWRLPSILGYAGAIAALLTPYLGDLAGSLAPLNVPADVWVMIGGALATVTHLGRVSQAVAPSNATPPVVTEPVPTEGGAEGFEPVEIEDTGDQRDPR